MTWHGVGAAVTASVCFVGKAILDEVHARVVYAWASNESVPRRGWGTSLKGVL